MENDNLKYELIKRSLLIGLINGVGFTALMYASLNPFYNKFMRDPEEIRITEKNLKFQPTFPEGKDFLINYTTEDGRKIILNLSPSALEKITEEYKEENSKK